MNSPDNLLHTPQTSPQNMSSMRTRSGVVAMQINVADRFISRFVGLMCKPPLCVLPLPEGLLLMHCPSIHTAFMRFAIDVVYLDANGAVTRCVSAVKPWRASHGYRVQQQGGAHRRTAHTLELPSGSIARYGIDTHSRLHHPALNAQATPT